MSSLVSLHIRRVLDIIVASASKFSGNFYLLALPDYLDVLQENERAKYFNSNCWRMEKKLKLAFFVMNVEGLL